MTYDNALLIGGSGGIGTALGAALPATTLTTLSRRADGLDLEDEATIAAAASRLDGPFDLIFDATGALEIEGQGPEKAFSALDPAAARRQFAVNALGPALILKHFARKMPRDRGAIFATLSARVGSIGDNRLGGWVSYRASKAALNQIVRTASIEIARTHPQAIVVALHPGTVTTPLTQKYLGRHQSVPPEEAAANLIRVLGSLTPAETGGFFDWAGKVVPW